MKLKFCLAWLALLCAPAFVWCQQSFHSLSKYDRTSDTTTVECDLISDTASGHLNLQAFASFRGKQAGETLRVWLLVSTSYGNATRKTPTRFHDAVTLKLELDEMALELSVKDYRRDYYELIQRLGESASIELSQSDWEKGSRHTTTYGCMGRYQIYAE